MRKLLIGLLIGSSLVFVGCGNAKDKYINENMKRHTCAYDEYLKDKDFVVFINEDLQKVDSSFSFECEWKRLLSDQYVEGEENYNPSNDVLKGIEDTESNFVDSMIIIEYAKYKKGK